MAGKAELCVDMPINSNLVYYVTGRVLARNQINGSIPVAWTESSSAFALVYLNLGFNMLAGEIPNANFRLT